MPITPFLKGEVFEPEIVRAMGVAFDSACKSLNVIDRSGPLGQYIAGNIIELAVAGEHDPLRLCERVVATYKPAE